MAIASVITSIVLLLLGVACTVGLIVAIVLAIRAPVRRKSKSQCVICGYPMHPSSVRCSECGHGVLHTVLVSQCLSELWRRRVSLVILLLGAACFFFFGCAKNAGLLRHIPNEVIAIICITGEDGAWREIERRAVASPERLHSAILRWAALREISKVQCKPNGISAATVLGRIAVTTETLASDTNAVMTSACPAIRLAYIDSLMRSGNGSLLSINEIGSLLSDSDKNVQITAAHMWAERFAAASMEELDDYDFHVLLLPLSPGAAGVIAVATQTSIRKS